MLQLAKAGELSAALVAFLTLQGGRAPSADVVSHFADRVGPAEAPLFKHLLHQAGPVEALPHGHAMSAKHAQHLLSEGGAHPVQGCSPTLLIAWGL